MGPRGRQDRTPRNGLSESGMPGHSPSGDQNAPPDGPATTAPVTLRTGVEADARDVAGLHVGQISSGFLSLLGTAFLERLYRRVVLFPGSFLVVADGPGGPVGFIAGSTDVSGLYKSFVWHDGLRAMAGAGRPLVSGWRRVLETLRHGGSSGVGGGRGGELLAVAVDPGCQGQGVGRQLVDAFLDRITANSCDAAHVVVGADNHHAVALYERCGFLPVEKFELHSGTVSLLMQWDRSNPPPPAARDVP
jgi:ribosomal protein S18 acetylase RimI-like enzyme